MKKSRILVAVVATLMMGIGVANAQTTISVGVAMPQGDFKSKSDVIDAYNNFKDLKGGAATGFQIGLRQQFTVPLVGLSLFASADLLYNGLDDSYKSENSNVEVTYPNYINVPLMLGVNYQLNIIPFIPILGIYAEAGVGVNARFITKYGMETTDVSSTITYSPAFTFAYQIGAGVKLLKLVSVGVNYYALGSAPIKETIDNGLNLDGVISEMTGDDMNPGILTLRVGLSF